MSTERKGTWMQVYTGRQWWPSDPRLEDLTVEDLAHMCAITTRFKGATRSPYSLAEHQVRVSQLLRDTFGAECLRLRRGGLCHDGHEVFDGIGDIVRPVKVSMPPEVRRWYDEHAAKNQAVVNALIVGEPLSDADQRRIKWADDTLLATEARDLMVAPPVPWEGLPPPLVDTIHPWPWRDAEELFLREIRMLSEQGR